MAKEKEAAKIEADEKALREHLINNLPKSQIGGIAGKLARVEVGNEEIPVIEDKEAFAKYARRKGNEDLMTFSLNRKAARERWDNNVAIPGVGKFNKVTLHLHSLKGKRHA